MSSFSKQRTTLDDRIDLADMSQKFIAQPLARARALHQAAMSTNSNTAGTIFCDFEMSESFSRRPVGHGHESRCSGRSCKRDNSPPAPCALRVTALKSVLFPTFGRPTIPARNISERSYPARRRLQGTQRHARLAAMRKANLADIHEEKSGSPSGKFCTFDKPLNEAHRRRSALERPAQNAGPSPSSSRASRPARGIIRSTATPRNTSSTSSSPGSRRSGTAMAKPRPSPATSSCSRPASRTSSSTTPSSTSPTTASLNNPVNDHGYYPDSDKWIVRIPEQRQIVKGERVDYYYGEIRCSGGR